MTTTRRQFLVGMFGAVVAGRLIDTLAIAEPETMTPFDREEFHRFLREVYSSMRESLLPAFTPFTAKHPVLGAGVEQRLVFDVKLR